MSWMRENRWWLVALAVLVPASIVAALWPLWFDYQERINGPVQRAEQGELVEYAGSQWRLDEWKYVLSTSAEGDDLELPVGTQLVAVLVTIEPGDPAPSCTAVLVDDTNDRWWRESVGSAPDFASASDPSNSCDTDATGLYQVVFTWIVPAEVGRSGAVELSVFDAAPLVLRFEP
jgi:hypothetical protein